MPPIAASDGPVAVTGCSGFTGAHMVRELVIHGYTVRACIRDQSSWRGKDCVNYLSTLPRVQIIDGCDLFTLGSFDAAFAGCTAVFHVAAVLGNSADGNSQPLGTGQVATDTYNGGLQGTQNVVSSVEKSGTVKRVIYTSSVAAVFGQKKIPRGYEWTETDWSSDGVNAAIWSSPANAYAKSKVDTEHFLNAAAEASGGKWDVVSFNPSMICGPLLFKAQHGQWLEQIARVATGLPPIHAPARGQWGMDSYWNIIDVRDLVKAKRLAAESTVDHRATKGGSRYLMHGCGGKSALRLGTDIVDILRSNYPSFQLGKPPTVTKSGKTIQVQSWSFNDSKKAKEVLGATFRPVEDTIISIVESSIELGLVTPMLSPKAKL